MANKRIPVAVLSSIPTQQGQVLKGEHLGILREVFSSGINANKHDVDRIIAGDVDAPIFYDTPTSEGLTHLENLENPTLNSMGYVITYKHIESYMYDGSQWVFQARLSLIDLHHRLKIVESAVDIDTSYVQELIDTINGIMQNLEQTIENKVIEATANKADLIGGKVPLDQLPDIESSKEVYIGVEEPQEPNNYSIWFKIEI